MIPTFNRTTYLAQALRSVLAQDLGPELMQIEVVDNGSSADIHKIVNDIAPDRVTFHRHSTNLGYIPNWNSCINRARGQFIHLLHDDDLVLPGFYSTLHKGLTANPQAAAGFTRHNFINDKNQVIFEMAAEQAAPGILPNFIDTLAVMQRIQFVSIVVKRSAYETLGGFRPDLRSACDWEMWQRIALHYPIYYEPQILASFRRHATSESTKLAAEANEFNDTAQVIDAVHQYLPPEKKHLSALARDHYASSGLAQAQQALLAGALPPALAQLRQALLTSSSPAILALLPQLTPAFEHYAKLLAAKCRPPIALADLQLLAGLRTVLAKTVSTFPPQLLPAVNSAGLHLIHQLFSSLAGDQPPPAGDLSPSAPSTGPQFLNFPKPSALAALKITLEQFQKNPADAGPLQSLLDARLALIQQFLSTPHENLEALYRADAGNCLRLLISANFPSLAAPLPQTHTAAILSQLHLTNPSSLVAATLALEPFQLNLPLDLTLIPAWFLQDFVLYLLRQPAFFRKEGEADAYARYMQNLTVYLAANITQTPDSPLWQKVADLFIQHARFITVYFNNLNLRDLYTHRAQIMSTGLTRMGLQLAHTPTNPPHPKIRFGILADHFGPQTETYTTLPVYKHLPRDRFDITLFALNNYQLPMQQYCVDHADRFVCLPKEIGAQLKILRDAHLDILWIGTNVTAVTNIVSVLALARIAPIHINSTSSCATSGMPNMDYYLSATGCEPPNAQEQYTEKLLLIDGPAHCIDHGTESDNPPTTTFTRAAAKIADDEFVFASGANFFKIIPEVAHTWFKILANVPNSRLLLYPFNVNWAPTYPIHAFMQHLTTMMQSHNISPTRLSIFPPAPTLADVKERLKLADLYLDSFPFSGVNSLLDPLAISLPPLVMDGTNFRSLMAASFMRELHLPELIAKDPAHYIELATELAKNKSLRTELSNKIKSAMTAPTPPLFLNPRAYSEKIAAVLQSLHPPA